ncbi:hypothetical protein ACFWY9_28930 [Amycolatopsis sp. NPDC059027]|uniref:hypothetical protein n=1 Tax=unclassified Amycolatopsis TaxID=2618356 RepID=UPI00366AB241
MGHGPARPCAPTVEVADKPAWRLAGQALWREALTVDARDDPAMQSMQEEAQRILATANAPRSGRDDPTR